jgi:hypothetical protein
MDLMKMMFLSLQQLPRRCVTHASDRKRYDTEKTLNWSSKTSYERMCLDVMPRVFESSNQAVDTYRLTLTKGSDSITLDAYNRFIHLNQKSKPGLRSKRRE